MKRPKISILILIQIMIQIIMIFIIKIFFIASFSAEIEPFITTLFYIHISFLVLLNILFILEIIFVKFRLLFIFCFLSSAYIVFALTLLLPFGISPTSYTQPFGYLLVIFSYLIYSAIELLCIYYLRLRDPKSRFEWTIYFGFMVTLFTILTPIIYYSSTNYPTLGGAYDYLLLATQLLFLLSLFPFCSVLWLCTNNVLTLQKNYGSKNVIIKLTENFGKEIFSLPIFFFILYSIYVITTQNLQFTIIFIAIGAFLSLIGYILFFIDSGLSKYLYHVMLMGGGLISVGIANEILLYRNNFSFKDHFIIETFLYPNIISWLIFFPTAILMVFCIVGIINYHTRPIQT